jgi:hypothetical protein
MSRTTSPIKLELWRDRLDQFSQGQQTVHQFCDSVGCSTATFHYWKRKLDLADPSADQLGSYGAVVKRSAFLPVIVRGGSSRPILVRVKDGTRIAVPADALSALEVILQHAHRVA